MIFKPSRIDIKTSAGGKSFASVVGTDATGAEYRCSVWEGNELLKVGENIEGDMITSGSFVNFKPRNAPKPAFARGGFAKPNGGNQAAKNAGIQAAQTNKEFGIAVAGAMRDATLITIAALKDQPFPTDEEFTADWRKWRDLLLKEYGNKLNEVKNTPFQ